MGNITAEAWIDKLDLLPHPEGGFFKEVYRSSDKIPPRGLPPRYGSERTFSTSIYYLLKSGQFSAFHKIKSDETWHFYSGSPLIIYMLNPLGTCSTEILGNSIENDEKLQLTIPKETWFAAEPQYNDSFSLLGCTVAPGFEFADFEMGKRLELIQKFSDQKEIITKFTNI